MKVIPAILLFCLLGPGAAFPDMYIWTDSNGIKHFSDLAPEEAIPYRQEKMVERDDTAVSKVKKAAGRAVKTTGASFTKGTSKKNTNSVPLRNLKRLAKKQTQLFELEEQMDAYHEAVDEKKRELERCQLRLEKTKGHHYKNHASHERRVRQWEGRVERAQQELINEEDKLDQLYDKISTLEADINRLK